MLDLNDKVALVTGAGSVGPGWGNGKATAVLFARQGAKVFGTDVNLAAAEETRAIIEKEGGTCVVRHCDMIAAGEVKAAVAACLESYGRIDILVNNVGRGNDAHAARGATPDEAARRQRRRRSRGATARCGPHRPHGRRVGRRARGIVPSFG